MALRATRICRLTVCPPARTVTVKVKWADFQQVTRSIALEDLRLATMNTPGYSFVANPDPARDLDLPTFNGQPKQPVESARVVEKQKVIVGLPLKLWNPLTW